MSRRTVERFAMVLGIFNLVTGMMALFSPFVKKQGPSGFFSRLMPMQKNKLLNSGTGQFLGFMGAVNPPHAAFHLALGSLGMAMLAGPMRRFNRAFIALSGALFAAMAVMGWMTVGTSSKTRKVMGFAVDMRDNILHTVLAAVALLMAAFPDMSLNQAMGTVQSTVDQVQNKVQDVVSRGQTKVDKTQSKVHDTLNKGQKEVDKAQRMAEQEVKTGQSA